MARPQVDGVIARLFDLGGLLGQSIIIASLSIVAYLIGALLMLPTGNRLVGKWVTVASQLDRSSRATEVEYHTLVKSLIRDLKRAWRTYAYAAKLETFKLPSDIEELLDQFASEDVASLERVSTEMRTRLLVTSLEMYGEYDRLAAEGEFRVNLLPPVMVIGFIVGSDIAIILMVPFVAAAIALFIQGANRIRSSTAVLMRAVISEAVEHPLAAKVREIRAVTPQYG